MCYCKKFVFQCFHVLHWGAPLRKCRQQETFEEGQHNDECDAKWAHPFTTFALPHACPECEVKRKAEEEERDARIEEWRKKDEEANKRWEEGDEKRKGTLRAFQVKLAEAKKKLEKLEKSLKSEGRSRKSLKKDDGSKDDDSDDEPVKKNES